MEEEPILMNGREEILKELMVKHKKPSFVKGIMGRGMKIGMVNMEDEDVSEWRVHGQIIKVKFQKVSELLEWDDFFPGK